MATLEYTGLITFDTPGIYTIKYCSIDAAGNVELVQTASYKILEVIVSGKSTAPHKGNVSASASGGVTISVAGKAASVSKGSVSVAATKNPVITVTGKFSSAYKGNILAYGTVSGDVIVAVSGIDVHPEKGTVAVVGGKSVAVAVHGKVGMAIKGFVNVSINDMQTASGNIRAGDNSLILVIDYQGNRIQILYA